MPRNLWREGTRCAAATIARPAARPPLPAFKHPRRRGGAAGFAPASDLGDDDSPTHARTQDRRSRSLSSRPAWWLARRDRRMRGETAAGGVVHQRNVFRVEPYHRGIVSQVRAGCSVHRYERLRVVIARGHAALSRSCDNERIPAAGRWLVCFARFQGIEIGFKSPNAQMLEASRYLKLGISVFLEPHADRDSGEVTTSARGTALSLLHDGPCRRQAEPGRSRRP